MTNANNLKNNPQFNNISKEKFKIATNRENIHDKAPETKPVGYFMDAWNRFKKNKGSVFASVIIAILVLFAIFGPIFSQYTIAYNDAYFAYCLPKTSLSEKFGWDFWDGCQDNLMNQSKFDYFYSIGLESERIVGVDNAHYAIKNQEYEVVVESDGTNRYQTRFDTYRRVGCIFKDLKVDEYNALQQYQDETGIQIIYPITEKKLRPNSYDGAEKDANYWMQTKTEKGKAEIIVDENGKYIPIYQAYTGLNVNTNLPNDGYFSRLFEVDENGERAYDYARKVQGGYEVRVNYYEYYIYMHTQVYKDGISEPVFLFGTSNNGHDLFTQLAGGARFSFLFAIVVATVNMIVGAIYGAIEGYYGGAADIIMERICDILGSIPTMIVITLLKLHMNDTAMQEHGHLLILFLTYFLTGWMGMAGRVRMQFYRFKNQEYVLAARTLGARDRRIMFKHIFPNSLGTIVTGSVLVIPGMIFSESSLSYLGIINLSTGDLTSVGTLLAKADPYLSSYPYMMVFPAVFISLLMLSFNLFGNGLRDAFNPSLRGAEE